MDDYRVFQFWQQNQTSYWIYIAVYHKTTQSALIYSAYICAYTYIHTYKYMYIYIHIHTHIDIYTHVWHKIIVNTQIKLCQKNQN